MDFNIISNFNIVDCISNISMYKEGLVMSNKSPQMESFLNQLSQEMFGRERGGKKCVTCGSDKVSPDYFRNNISRKEFGISCMCQVCQDATFGKD